MEQKQNTNNEQIKTPEDLKQESFAQVMRSILFRFNQERDTLSTFNFGGRQIEINNKASAVKALGQLPTSMAEAVYQQVTSRQ